eukprot:5654590-Prymnesium_polylepis.1
MALHREHRIASLAVTAAGALVHPQLSAFGRPLEPMLTCSAVLLGFLVGDVVEGAYRRFFEDQQASKRRLREAQQQAQCAIEQQRNVEAESIAFQLRAAQANRAADSRLNHMIKGLCGSAKTYYQHHLQKLQADGNHQYIETIECISLLLKKVITWIHEHQVFVSLEDGSYRTRQTGVVLEDFLREKLHGDELHMVQVGVPQLAC